ncbi:MAG: XdhC family protein [Cyanobacteria bacterium P01_D01_bin.56]
MPMIIEFYQKLVDTLCSQAAMVATVIEIKGSVPREVGAKMLIGTDWTFDTIGGGAGEAKIIQQGRSVLTTGQKQIATIDLTGDTNILKEGICGGQMSIWLERWSGPDSLYLAQQILTALKHGQQVQLLTPLTSADIPTVTQTAMTTTQLSGTAFIECLQPPPLLLIVGAGHIGVVLAKVAHLAGFQIAIQDERPEFANAHMYPQASFISTKPIAQTLREINPSQTLFVALVTRGYPMDLAALSSIFNQDITCRYIGMMGSQKRVQIVLQSLRDQGISDQQLNLIHAPIGANIGALTPGEIAVSICAELIQVKRARHSHASHPV